MSALKNNLSGKQSVILWKKYRKQVNSDGTVLWAVLLRFVVEDFSAVVFGTSPYQFVAGARAMKAYVEFCQQFGMEHDALAVFPDGYEPSQEQLDKWNEIDERWINL